MTLDQPPSLSIVIPAFNEANTLGPLFDALRRALDGFTHEIILVDDGSTDGTSDIVKELSRDQARAFFHLRNQGKGAALRTALEHAKGDIVVIQDADFEYDPKDIPRLIQPILENHADAVFGSRFHGPTQRIHLYWHQLANRWLTWFTNIVYDLNLSDMETGYKAFRRSAIDGMVIRQSGFGVEPELTAKLAKKKFRIYEVPISYYGRDYSQGKKIGFRDAVWAAWCIIRYRFAD